MHLATEALRPMTLGRNHLPPPDFINLQNLPDPVVASEARFRRGFASSLHRHERGQLILVVAEPAVVDVAAQRWTLAPGQAFWLPGGIEHGVSSHRAPYLRSLYFRPDIAARIGRDPACLRTSPFLAELGCRLAGLFSGRGDPATYPHLVALLLAEVGGGANLVPELPMPQDRRLRIICDGLGRDPADRRTLAEWCAESGASCRTLERLFRQETGMGFATWRQLCRIHAAIPLLQHRIPVQVVAWQVGYDSPGAFATAFRKVTGASPTDYRSAA